MSFGLPPRLRAPLIGAGIAAAALAVGAIALKDYGDQAAIEACYRAYAAADDAHPALEGAIVDSVRARSAGRGARTVHVWLTAPGGKASYDCRAVQDQGTFGWTGHDLELTAPEPARTP